MKIAVAKLDKVSDICISIGQVIFASVFIDPLVNGSYNWLVIILGLTLAVLAWLLSLAVVNNKNYE